MDLLSGEYYLISKAKEAQTSDPYAAKAWILAAKTLYPNNYGVQFEAFCLEKSANNFEAAAKCFSYIILTFPNPPPDLWNEISQLTAALRIPEGMTTVEEEFYVKMFQHISYEVQQKILLLTANNSDNNLEHCKLILLLMKRFPQAIHTHSPRLIETIIQGIANNQIVFREMLITEVIPLIINNPPDLTYTVVNRVMAICIEYYVNQMFNENLDDKSFIINESWTRIFEVLDMCGRILKWDTFLLYNKNWSKDLYWQRLLSIVHLRPTVPADNKQILFYATILFVVSLQEYINNVKHKINDIDVEFILVEGVQDHSLDSKRHLNQEIPVLENAQISINYPCNGETPICLVTAAQCWQLLHSNEILQMDFSQLLMCLPLSNWINRFLIDLAVYLGRNDEAQTLLEDTTLNNVEKNLRSLSLIGQNQSAFNVQMFELILSIFADLPVVQGYLVNNLSSSTNGRHLLLLPLTRRAVIQYCTKMIVNILKQQILSDPNCSDTILGNLLVLLQIDWPYEQALAETIFSIIRTRRQFIYLQFSKYIICPDMIEEFMSMWYPHGGDVHLEFISPQTNLATRRIGTRGADRGVKEDFKQIIKQQMLKSNENVEQIIVEFITQENLRLIQN